MPITASAGDEIIATLEFTPTEEDFQEATTIWVEEPTGLRGLTIRAISHR